MVYGAEAASIGPARAIATVVSRPQHNALNAKQCTIVKPSFSHLGHAPGLNTTLKLGTGTGFSVREILSAVAAETGGEVPHVVKPRRSGDPTYLVADPAAARETLKFRTTHSDPATIIRTAWAWHQTAHPLK